MIPRLHVVTDDHVLARPDFAVSVRALAEAFGDDLALHLRGHGTATRRLHALAEEVEGVLSARGALLLVADRGDVALATATAGLRVGARSIPVAAARRLMGRRPLCCSVHSAAESEAAVRDGADFLVLGTIWATASHPGRPGAGPALVREVAERVEVPVVAIGGITPERVPEAIGAGAGGVAVLSGVWAVADPVAAARGFVRALDAAGRHAAVAR